MEGSPGSFSHTVGGLTTGQRHWFRVRAMSGETAGPWTGSRRLHPAAVVTITPNSDFIIEGSDAQFRVSLSPAPEADTAVTVRVAAQGSFGVENGRRTVTVPAGEDGATLTVATTDGDDEEPGSITARVDRPRGYAKGTPNSAVMLVAVVSVEVVEEEEPESDEHHQGDTPHEPRNVSLSRNDKNNELVVSWQAPADTAAVTQWIIQCDTSDQFNTGNFKQLSPLAQGDLAFAVDARYSVTCTDLETNNRYYARVAARNVTSDSDWTAASSHLTTRSVVSIRANSDSVTEGQDAVFTVTLHPAPSSATNVTVVVTDVSGDYGINTGSRTVSVSGVGTGTLTLPTTDDTIDEPKGSVSVRVHPAPTGYSKGNPNSAGMTINDNDEPGEVLTATVAADSAAITEGGSAEFTVTLDPAPAASVDVRYNITVSGGDYGVSAANNRMVSVGTGGTGTITLPTTDDSTAESNGSVTVTLVAGAGYSPGALDSATVTVYDDERPLVSIAPGASPVTEGTAARFTILPTGALTGDLVVTVAVAGGTDFGVSQGTQTVTLTPAAPVALLEVATTGDSTAENAADITVTVQSGTEYNAGVGSATVRINDDDGGLNAPASFRAVPSSKLPPQGVGEQGFVATANVSWAAPPNPPQVGGSSAITGYELQYSLREGFTGGRTPIWTYTKILAATRTSIEVEKGRFDDVDQVMEEGVADARYFHQLPELRLRQNGFFRIRAFTGASDARVPGPWSPILRIRPSEFDQASVRTSDGVLREVQPPGAPSPVVLVPGDYSPVVYWGVPAHVGGNTIVAYDLRYRWNGGPWTEVLSAWSHSSGTLSHAIPYRRFGEALEVQVHADSEVTANYCAAYDDLGQGNDADNRQKCLWAKGPWSSSASANFAVNDYDTDDDGLIEVDSLARLNAIRYDLDGDAVPDDGSEYNEAGADAAGYDPVFPYPSGNSCDKPATPDTTETCKGYELTASLDFDTNGSGSADSGDTYWNGGEGWDPLTDGRTGFTAVFEGNDNTIANLFISRARDDRLGLFGQFGESSDLSAGVTVRNLTLTGASVTGDDYIGILAGRTFGVRNIISSVSVSGSVTAGDDYAGGLIGRTETGTSISGSSASGSVSGGATNGTLAGGLVGANSGEIASSYSNASVSSAGQVGGLAGRNEGAIRGSYAAGAVSGSGDNFGGLTGYNSGAVIASYATGSVTVSGTADNVGGLVGTNSLAGAITASYATGAVSGSSSVGGLVGVNNGGPVTDSYFDRESTGRLFGIGGDDVDSNNLLDDNTPNPDGTFNADGVERLGSYIESNSLPGHTGAELRAPTGYSGIYADWNLDLDNADTDDDLTTGPDDPWDFGANYNYPTLKNAPGKQKGPGPVTGLAVSFNDSDQAVLGWTAPTDAGDGTLTGYAGRYSSDGGATWTDFTETGTSHTITALSDADTFTVQVWAITQGAAHTASLRSTVNYAPPDENAPTATVAAGTTPITEGGNAVFTVTLSPAPAADISVSYNITVSGDYGVSAATNQMVTVGTTGTGSISLTTGTDAVDEPNGSVTVTLVAGTGYSVGTANSASVTVNDDDDPTATVTATNAAVTEGGNAVFTVTLSRAQASDVAVTYNLTETGDFGVPAAANQTVTVNAGQTTGTITISTTGDSADEADGSVTVTLASGTGYAVGTANAATVTVNDDDDPTVTVAANNATITEGGDAVFTVTLSRAQTANVAVTYNVTVAGDYGVSAASNQTVTVSSGATTGTITLSTTDDSAEETSGSVTVTLASGTGYAVGMGNAATVNVNDNDTRYDYDSDDNGLIEVDSLARLDAIRYDMNGDGVVDDSANNDAYAAAFPRPAGNQCDDPGTDGTTETCTGYELTASLDFDTNGNGVADSGDTYWNDGKGWRSIGGLENARYDTGFNAIFEGNGNTISNLFIDRESTNADTWAAYRVGLFGVATQSSVIRNLTLAERQRQRRGRGGRAGGCHPRRGQQRNRVRQRIRLHHRRGRRCGLHGGEWQQHPQQQLRRPHHRQRRPHGRPGGRQHGQDPPQPRHGLGNHRQRLRRPDWRAGRLQHRHNLRQPLRQHGKRPQRPVGRRAGGPERRPLRQGPGHHRRQLSPGRRHRPGRRGRTGGRELRQDPHQLLHRRGDQARPILGSGRTGGQERAQQQRPQRVLLGDPQLLEHHWQRPDLRRRLRRQEQQQHRGRGRNELRARLPHHGPAGAHRLHRAVHQLGQLRPGRQRRHGAAVVLRLVQPATDTQERRRKLRLGTPEERKWSCTDERQSVTTNTEGRHAYDP